MERNTVRTLIGPATVAAVAAFALAAATALASCAAGTSTHRPASAPSVQYSYYRSMMARYHGSMMGSGLGSWMMGMSGYQWMTGMHGIPGWMHGGRLPSYMMGTNMMGTGADPGKIMGRFWADAPGSRISKAQAIRLGDQTPAGARVERASRTITFTTTSVRLTVLASPAGGPDETFRIAGLVNPKLIVPAGARVSIKVINADPDTAHGLVITASHYTRSWMPMMTTQPAFSGSALWFLGNPTRAGMHTGTLTFTAATPGNYRYLCAVPGHARKGMTGTLIVTTAK